VISQRERCVITAALAIEDAQYSKLKNPHADVTVRDLEGVEETVVIQPQQPQGRAFGLNALAY
jgi:hypothetical protein